MKKSLSVLMCSLFISSMAIAAASNDELKIGISQEFETLNPIIMQMVATTYINSMVNRTLDTMDANGKWVPQLAKEIPSIDKKTAKLSADKKHVISTWEIRDNAKWSDGQPVTCDDILFSTQVAASATVSVPDKETYSQVEKVEWDPKTPRKCILTYDKPRWDFYMMGTFYILPRHIEGEVFNKFKDQKEGYEKNTNYTKNPTMDGLYNGPYKVAEVKLGSHVTLVPNPTFYGTPPKIKKVIVKLIPNTGTMEANLRSGTIDMISSLGLSFDEAVSMEKKSQKDNLPFNTMFKSSLTYEHIDLNLDNPVLKDLKVRKALVYSINREELVKALFDGKQQVAIHNMTTIDPWYTADPKKVVLYPYSKKEAGKLLDEAGWKMNAADGYRYKDGKKLALQFMTTAGNKTRETVQTFLQGQWKSVGVEISIKNQPARVFFGDTTRKRQFEAMCMYAWVSSPESNPKSNVHSTSIPTEKNGWSGQNVPGWSNPKVDAIIEKLEVEFNPKKRVQLAAEFLKYYTDEVPVIPLYYRADTATVPKNLKNFRLMGHQFYETNDIETWSVQ